MIKKRFFLSFATTLMDLLFIEHMLHLSHVKQMYSQTIHLTHEFVSFIAITKRMVDLTETPWWKLLVGPEIRTVTSRHRFLALQPFLPYRIMSFSWLRSVRPHSIGQYSRGTLLSDHQQIAIQNTVQTLSQSLNALKEICRLSAWLICSCNGARLLFFLSAIPRVPKWAPYPSMIKKKFRN